MRANPGGQIPPSEVIGRDSLIGELWRILARQSVVLRAERRMGKTCIIQKMKAEGEEGHLLVYRDLEGMESPLDNVPFYIHHVVDAIAGKRAPLDEKNVEALVVASLTDPDDCWHLQYYMERIQTYYPDDLRPFAFAILDILSTADRALTFDELFELLKSRISTEDREVVLDVLKSLQRDHYLRIDERGAYRFALSLVRRFWVIHRGSER